MAANRAAQRACLSLAVVTAALAPGGLAPAAAQTLRDAMEMAYRANPALNAQRVGAQAVGENLPRATAGYLPKVGLAADVGVYQDVTKPSPEDCSRAYLGATIANAGCSSYATDATPRGGGVQFNQNLFDGFRTTNSVRQAKVQISGAQAQARVIEQNTLLQAVTAYTDVLADRAIVAAAARNVEVLGRQLGETKARHAFGDVTRTDVAQIESRLAAARAQENLARASLEAHAADYSRVIGAKPQALTAPRDLSELIPASVGDVVAQSLANNPAIAAAKSGIDVALLQTQIIRGELLPNVSLNGGVARRYDLSTRGDERTSKNVSLQMTMPLYDGGDVAARTRQTQFVATQRRLEADSVRDEVKALAEKSWAQYQAARGRVGVMRAQIEAARTALDGLQKEWSFGERTLREVLDAQQEMTSARINSIIVQRDLIVSSFAVAQAMGILNLHRLGPTPLSAGNGGVFALGRDADLVKPWPRKLAKAELAARACPDCRSFAAAWTIRGN